MTAGNISIPKNMARLQNAESPTDIVTGRRRYCRSAAVRKSFVGETATRNHRRKRETFYAAWERW